MAWRSVAVLTAELMALVCLAAPAGANDLEYFTGESLYADCRTPADAPDHAARAGRCEGYVLGASDATQMRQNAGGAQRVCLPAGADASRVVGVVIGYLEAHPEKRRLAAQDLILDALSAQFPCK